MHVLKKYRYTVVPKYLTTVVQKPGLHNRMGKYRSSVLLEFGVLMGGESTVEATAAVGRAAAALRVAAWMVAG